jgi:hypothetical protein
MHCSRLGLLEVDHNHSPGPWLPLERNPAKPFFVEEFLGFPGLSSEPEVERSHQERLPSRLERVHTIAGPDLEDDVVVLVEPRVLQEA